MKKLLSLIILSMLVCFSAQAEEKVYSIDETKKCAKDETLLCDLDGSLITGYFKEYYSDGTLWYEKPYKDGKRDGVHKEYFIDGTLWIEHPYKDGKEDGVVKEYHENGTLARELYYENGKNIKEIRH